MAIFTRHAYLFQKIFNSGIREKFQYILIQFNLIPRKEKLNIKKMVEKES